MALDMNYLMNPKGGSYTPINTMGNNTMGDNAIANAVIGNIVAGFSKKPALGRKSSSKQELQDALSVLQLISGGSKVPVAREVASETKPKKQTRFDKEIDYLNKKRIGFEDMKSFLEHEENVRKEKLYEQLRMENQFNLLNAPFRSQEAIGSGAISDFENYIASGEQNPLTEYDMFLDETLSSIPEEDIINYFEENQKIVGEY